MRSFILLIFCLVLGVLAGRFAKPPEGLARSLNWFVLNIALPAMVLAVVPNLRFDASLWFLVASLWLTFLCGWVLFHFIGTRLQWSRSTIGAVVMTAGLSNTAFAGFPLIEALRGKELLSYAAFADQLGSFMMVTVGGNIAVAFYSGGRVDVKGMVRRISTLPSFIAILIALLMALTPGWPTAVEYVLTRISSTMIPIVLFSLGLQLRPQFNAQRIAPFCAALSWKLVLAPLLMLGLGILVHVDRTILTVGVLQSAMPPMLAAAIMAEQGNLDPPLANMMAGLGILMAFITVPLLNLLL